MSDKTNYVAIGIVVITAALAIYFIIRTERSIDAIVAVQKNNSTTTLEEN